MRKLIRRTRRQERGVTTIVVALSFTGLLAAAGMGIDTASVALERSRIQHSADAGATAIAYDCAEGKLNCNNLPGISGAKDTANFYAAENSSGGTVSIPGGVTVASTSVEVQVDKSVPTRFFGAFGVTSKSVRAKAKASWNKHPINGTVLPFAVSLCEYQKKAIGANTIVNSDINDLLKDANSYLQSDPLLVVPACPVPAQVSLPSNPTTVSSFQGGLWLSENEGANNVCNGKVNLEVLELTYASAKNETCVKKYEDELTVGQILFMAVYAPNANYNHGGIRGSGGNIVDMQILGFAPFEVKSWCLAKTCNRPNFEGKFLKTTKTQPGFVYGTGVANFGASKVELVG